MYYFRGNIMKGWKSTFLWAPRRPTDTRHEKLIEKLNYFVLINVLIIIYSSPQQFGILYYGHLLFLYDYNNWYEKQFFYALIHPL